MQPSLFLKLNLFCLIMSILLTFVSHVGICQSRSQSPRSSVGGIVGLWEKAQKNARHSLHSITIGSSALASAQYTMEPLQGVENYVTRKNYVPSSFKNSSSGIKMLNHIESKPVEVFVMNICDMVACLHVICIV